MPVEGGGGGGGETDYKYANGGPANWPCIPPAAIPKTSNPRRPEMQYRNLSLGFLIPTVQNCGGRSPEMEFLDINLTKDSSLLLYAIHRPSTGRFERNPYSSLVF